MFSNSHFALTFSRALPAIALCIFICTSVSNAQDGMPPEQYRLGNKDSLSIVGSESWNGEATEMSVDLVLTKAADGSQLRILNHPLFRWGADLRNVPHDGVIPSIKSVVEQDGKIAILYSTMFETTVDGHYLLLDRTGDNFRKVNALDLAGLFPSNRTVRSEKPLEARLLGLDGIHMVHHDLFTVDIRIASDNSVTINGKPCSPGNVPIEQLSYRHFLSALSPYTAERYDSGTFKPQPIVWWEKPTIAPPFSYQDYSQMRQVIHWTKEPAIIFATYPDDWKAAMLKMNPALLNQKPDTSTTDDGKISKPVPPAPIESHRSSFWLVCAVAVVSVIGLLWMFFKKGNKGSQ